MGTIVANIKEIGIFMIAAQAVMHFAPGKHYEKYIKLIASVMVLLLFMRPFVSGADEIEAEWEEGMEQITQSLEEQDTGQDSQSLWGNAMVRDTAMQQIEEEIQTRLNLELEQEEYRVTEVEIQLEETETTGVREEDAGWNVGCIRIVMEKQDTEHEPETGENEDASIKIDKITVDLETDDRMDSSERTDLESTYRSMFADVLGIGEDRVEVICRGGW